MKRLSFLRRRRRRWRRRRRRRFHRWIFAALALFQECFSASSLLKQLLIVQAHRPSLHRSERNGGKKAPRQRFILSFPGSRSSFRATTSSTALAVSAPLLRPLEAFFDKRTSQLARGLSNSLQVSESSAERSSPSTSKAPKRSRDRSIAFKKNRNLLPLSLSLLPS